MKTKFYTRLIIGTLGIISFLFFSAKNWEAGFFFLILTIVAFREFKNEFFGKKVDIDYQEHSSTTYVPPISHTEYLIYAGDNLHFTNDELAHVLNKYFHYYTALSVEDKEKFLHRLRSFIAAKKFCIHDKSGFKEMPILISASAIQLTFGLKHYLITHFTDIHIYPQEFVRANYQSICFLEGNVSDNDINLSWKHFLDGYKYPDNGQNVGLHEMAHALYFQIFEIDKYSHRPFKQLYDAYLEDGNRVYHLENNLDEGLYSEYAMKNIHEFWAESIEIFFEKPKELKKAYPDLYSAMSLLLNQNPALA